MAQYYGTDAERQRAQQTGAYQAPTYTPAPLANQASPGAGYRSTATTSAPSAPASPKPYDPYEAFRTSNQTGTADEILRRGYKTFTGRDADEAGLRSHMSNPAGLEGAMRTIYDSPESQKYRTANAYDFQDPATRGPRLGPDGKPAVVAGVAPIPSAVQPSIYTGYTPKYAMEGFAFDREQNTGKSAKDAFAYLANQAPPPPINNKAALGEWFSKYIKPGMDSLGHKVSSVDGDKFRFSNWQGTFDVDYGRGAGAEGGALAWQVDDGTAQMANGPYVPLPTNGKVNADVPVVGQPDPNVSTTQPISSSIQYRRPYDRYAANQYAAPPPSAWSS